MPTVIITFSDILQIFVKISLIAWEEEGTKSIIFIFSLVIDENPQTPMGI